MDIVKEKTSIPAQRQKAISDHLAIHTSITVKEAAMLCGVSEATARRDIDEMAANGLLERTHGGAVLHRGLGYEEYHAEKMKIMIPEKMRIVSAAARLINPGDCLFLDSGTTTFLLAEQLQLTKQLTVVTNNLDIAYNSKLDSSSTMVVTGGIRRDGYSILVGDLAQEMIGKLCVDFAFVGVDAINADFGVFCSNFVEIGVKKSIVSIGKKRVLMADSSKFKKKALAKVCDLTEFDILITDDGISEETRKKVEEKIEQVIIV